MGSSEKDCVFYIPFVTMLLEELSSRWFIVLYQTDCCFRCFFGYAVS